MDFAAVEEQILGGTTARRGDAAAALRNSADLARHVESLGYRRYWLAEHHNMPGIASAATAVVIELGPS